MRQLVAAQGRIASFRLTIASALGSFTPLFRRAGSIEVPLGPPRRTGVGHWDGAVLSFTHTPPNLLGSNIGPTCVSVDPVLSGCVV